MNYQKRTYVIPDIHGRMDLLDMALSEIERREADRPKMHKVVFLGDYIDRGPQSCQVLQHLFGGRTAGKPWILIQGNHEQMMLLANQRKIAPVDWLKNGGYVCLDSYPQDQRVMDDHVDRISRMRSYYEDAHRVYVHATVDPKLPLDKQTSKALRWAFPSGDVGYRGRHVVHGHADTGGEPLLLRNRTNLDCGAYRTGTLVFAMFDDAVPGGPVEILRVSAGG